MTTRLTYTPSWAVTPTETELLLGKNRKSPCIKAISKVFVCKFSIEIAMNCIIFFCQVLKYSIVQSKVLDHILIHPIFFVLKYSGGSLQPPPHQDGGACGSSGPSRSCKMGSVTPRLQLRHYIITHPPSISTSPL